MSTVGLFDKSLETTDLEILQHDSKLISLINFNKIIRIFIEVSMTLFNISLMCESKNLDEL